MACEQAMEVAVSHEVRGLGTSNDNGKAAGTEDAAPADIFSIDVTRHFNKSAGHIEGHLVPMDENEVRAVQDRFNDNIDRQVEQATDGMEVSRGLRTALAEYINACSITRQNIKAKDISKTAKLPIEEIEGHTKDILSDISDVEAYVAVKLASRAHSSRFANDPASRIFEDRGRVYFRLEDKSISSIEPFVRVFLESRGFKITDYKKGLASNDGGKNHTKIGKILRRYDAPARLAEAYSNDPCRVQKNLMVILTRNPVDIARGSHGRAWKSCRADAYSAASNGVDEYYAGVIAAYLVTEDDPYIHSPLGRLYMKPYDSSEGTESYNDDLDRYEYSQPSGDTVYFTFNPIGLHFPAFPDAVNRYADDNFNCDRTGRFYMRPGCEFYREQNVRHRLPNDAKAALKQLGVKFKKASAGQIVVNDNVDMAGMGLHKLPDLTGVEIKGYLDVSGNKLLSLAGLPKGKVGSLCANGTLISSFHGSPELVEDRFSYVFSPYLESTAGMPRAQMYEYGGNYNSSSGTMRQRCISPMESPESFARFKR